MTDHSIEKGEHNKGRDARAVNPRAGGRLLGEAEVVSKPKEWGLGQNSEVLISGVREMRQIFEQGERSVPTLGANTPKGEL